MLVRRNLLQTGIFLCILLSSLRICAAQDNADDTRHSTRELTLQYAKTRMDLAETELAWAMESNTQYDGVVPSLTVERLRSNLRVAKEQYEQSLSASSGGPASVRLRHAEEEVRLTGLQFQEGRKSKNHGELSDVALKRLKLKHELARLKFALLHNPENFVTLLESMQNQIDRFGEEILSLDQRIARLEAKR